MRIRNRIRISELRIRIPEANYLQIRWIQLRFPNPYGMFALLWLEREMEEWSVTMRSEVDAVLLRTQYTIR